MRINIKPLSVNDAWQGKRFKTDKYKRWEKDLLFILPNIKVPNGKLQFSIQWGFSSSGSDIDNPCKPFLDVLQKKYNFNDSRIYHLELKREQVKKGKEYIDFKILPYNET